MDSGFEARAGAPNANPRRTLRRVPKRNDGVRMGVDVERYAGSPIGVSHDLA